MNSFERKLIVIAVGLLAVAIHQSVTLEAEYADDDIETYELSTLRSWDSLTPEEEELANEAKAHIAKTIEHNLIRLLAIASAQSERQPRQDDDDDAPDPNVLPQVAQILSAIFSGSLNISRVVDRTFGLVPNIVRNQVGGLVKLLTGENMTATAAGASTNAPSSAASTPLPVPVVVMSSPAEATLPAKAQTPPPAAANEQVPNEVEVVDVVKVGSSTKAPEPALEEIALNLSKLQGNNTAKNKYRVRNRNKLPSTTTKTLLEDDEIEKLEEDLKRVAKAYEPYQRNPEPRFIADAFRRVFARVDLNNTQFRKAVPTIFKGARQALVVLDNLGILDANDLLDDLGLPIVEELED